MTGKPNNSENLRGVSFDPETLSGVSFLDLASKRNMRYIYPDAGHWCAGWILAQFHSGEWMTWRKATDADISALTSGGFLPVNVEH